MKLSKTNLLAVLPGALAATTADCQLGTNMCDTTNSSVMICGARGWKLAETCFKAGACHLASAGNAYCDKEAVCFTGQTQCDAANYVAQACNDQGFWQVDRKCSKLGCCEVRHGKAVCKAECGPGLKPPGVASTITIPDETKPGDRCPSIGEGYCDAVHNCILRCRRDNTIYQESCCKNKGGCTYDNASLEPYCS